MDNKAKQIILANLEEFNKHFLDGETKWSYDTHDTYLIIYQYSKPAKLIRYNDIFIWHENRKLREFIHAKDTH